jgi:L-lactate dehydrogenase complex protein LldG
MSTARAEVLSRIGMALRASPPPADAPAPSYRRSGSRTPEERTALFCRRTGDYRAEVRRVWASGITAAVDAALESRGARQVIVPPGLPAVWRPTVAEVIEDDGRAARELDALDGVVTGCTVAIAETGTLALTGAADEGRRAITLVPDLHVCVVEERRIVELVPEAFAILDEAVTGERRPVTLVSGPSATSDIELNRVEGVHGPRTLVVLVVSEEVP